MGLRINTNVAALAARRALSGTAEKQSKNYQRLASGNRITSAADDAAGLAISDKMKSHIRSMGQAHRNAQDGISLVQVAEGGMSEASNLLIRMRELAVQAASDTVGDRERGFINQEVMSLVQEVDRIANVTDFNGTPLLNGQAPKGQLEFQVGIYNKDSDRILMDVNNNDIRVGTLGLDGVGTVSIEEARESLDKVDSALSMVNERRAGLGAMQNKLHATSNNLSVASEMLSQARSRIADADIAEESSELVRQTILQNAGVTVLAQANQSPQMALKLM